MCFPRSQDKLVILVTIRQCIHFHSIFYSIYSINEIKYEMKIEMPLDYLCSCKFRRFSFPQLFSRLLFFYLRFYVLFILGFFVENEYAYIIILHIDSLVSRHRVESSDVVFGFKQLERTTYLVVHLSIFQVFIFIILYTQTHDSFKTKIRHGLRHLLYNPIVVVVVFFDYYMD